MCSKITPDTNVPGLEVIQKKITYRNSWLGFMAERQVIEDLATAKEYGVDPATTMPLTDWC